MERVYGAFSLHGREYPRRINIWGDLVFRWVKIGNGLIMNEISIRHVQVVLENEGVILVSALCVKLKLGGR